MTVPAWSTVGGDAAEHYRNLATELTMWLPASALVAAQSHSPHVIAAAAHRVARAFHMFYESNRVVVNTASGEGAACDDKDADGGPAAVSREMMEVDTARLRHERLLLCAAADVGLRWGLHVLGVAPVAKM